MHIKPYQIDYKKEWNDFITKSSNGTFLLYRDFMEYHSDRFKDASLMVFDNSELICCISGNQIGRRFYSHQGLTYGGLIWDKAISYLHKQEVIDAVHQYLSTNYEYIRWHWPSQCYDEQLLDTIAYLNQKGYHQQSVFNNLEIPLQQEIKISSKKTAGYRNGKFDELNIEESSDFSTYWNQMLIPQLSTRHNASPVHSLEEIERLHQSFPDNIKLYLVYESGNPVAGACFFMKANIIKSQYAASSLEGFTTGALDFLYQEIINEYKNLGFDYLDLGHVNNPDGSINRGLQRFKEELGGINTIIYRSEFKNNEIQ